MNLIKLAGFIGVAIGLVLVMSGNLSNSDKENFAETCVTAYQKESSNPFINAIDIKGFCGCLSDKNIKKNPTYDAMKPCLDTYMKDTILNSCETDMNTGMTLNCECVYGHLSQWIWRNAESKRPGAKPIEKSEETQFSLNMLSECQIK